MSNLSDPALILRWQRRMEFEDPAWHKDARLGQPFFVSWSGSSGRGCLYTGPLDYNGPGRTLFEDGRRTCNPGFGGSAAALSLANINTVVQFWLIIELLRSRIHNFVTLFFKIFVYFYLYWLSRWDSGVAEAWLPRDGCAVEVELLVLTGTGVFGRLRGSRGTAH